MNDREFIKTLKTQLKKAGKQQKAVAIEWESRQGELDLEFSWTSVESRLSELLQGKRPGWDFFFSDRARGRLLLDLLAFESETAMALLDSGVELASAAVSARTLVDVRYAKDDPGEVFWDRCRQFISDPGTPRPIRLLQRPEQHRRLPRDFDSIVDLNAKPEADESRHQ